MAVFNRFALSSLFLTISLLICTSVNAATYYVAITGNDNNNGSASTPFLTLQKAANLVVAGDTVHVRPGNYAGFVLGWDDPQNGSPGAPITFQGDFGAAITTRNNKTPDGINLEGASYITIEGFLVQNMPRAGIRSVQNNHVIIRNNITADNNTWGIFTSFSDDLLIENNTTARSKTQHGIYVSNSCTRPVVRGNTIYGNCGCGLHMNGDLSQGGNGLITFALVEKNIIFDNGTSAHCSGGTPGGSAINGDGVQSSIIRNNLLYNNHASGISLYDIDAAQGAKNNFVLNNTVLMASDSRWALNIKDQSTGNTALNNILLNLNSAHGSINISSDSLSGFTSDYNITEDRFSPDDGDSFETLAQWKNAHGQDAHSFIATYQSIFTDAFGGDYSVRSSSPSVDHGTTHQNVTDDIIGTSRPQGGSFDIGSTEFTTDSNGGGDTDPTATPTPSPTPTATPTPKTTPNSHKVKVKLSTRSAISGKTISITVQLDSAVLPGEKPVTVMLSSSDKAIKLPRSVIITQGHSSKTLQVKVGLVKVSRSVTITAALKNTNTASAHVSVRIRAK